MYPRYSREQNLACKLKTHQIDEIKKLYEEGHSQRFLAKKFGVSRNTIMYWVTPGYREKAINKSKKRAEQRKIKNPELFRSIQSKIVIKAKKRKQNSEQSEQYREWENEVNAKRYKEKHEIILKQRKLNYLKNYVYGTKLKPWLKYKKKCSKRECNNLIRYKAIHCRSCANKLMWIKRKSK